MTQTVRHITSSRTCDIYSHPDQAKPFKGYKNSRCRYKYTVNIEDIDLYLESSLGSSIDIATEEEVIENNLLFLVLEMAKGNNYIISDGQQILYARTLKEAQDKFSNFYC